jgi:universal stress protein A
MSMSSIRTIVVPHDFSEYADAALDVALELSQALNAELHLLHILQPPAYAYGGELYAGPSGPDLLDERIHEQRAGERRLRSIAARHTHTTRPIRVHVVDGTRVADAIDREAAQLVADLIVMGTHGRTGLAHLLLGSVAEATLRHAPCPVLTVPRQKRVHVESRHDLAEREPAPGAL